MEHCEEENGWKGRLIRRKRVERDVDHPPRGEKGVTKNNGRQEAVRARICEKVDVRGRHHDSATQLEGVEGRRRGREMGKGLQRARQE